MFTVTKCLAPKSYYVNLCTTKVGSTAEDVARIVGEKKKDGRLQWYRGIVEEVGKSGF